MSVLNSTISLFQTSIESETSLVEQELVQEQLIVEQSQEVIKSEVKIKEDVAKEEKHEDFIMDQSESKKMEELFDKLVEKEVMDKGYQLINDSSMDSLFRTASTGDDYHHDGDESSAADESTLNSASTVLHSGKNTDCITDGEDTTVSEIRTRKNRRDSERRLSLTNTTQPSAERLKMKRKRNKTIDNHDLWCVTVAQYTQKTYTKEEPQGTGYTKEETACQTLTDGEQSGAEDGLGQGLGIIIDKLKNIETKLDELKTIDHEDEFDQRNGTI